ncbi:unnamed protein product, partial [Didymodactylos carnosus]
LVHVMKEEKGNEHLNGILCLIIGSIKNHNLMVILDEYEAKVVKQTFNNSTIHDQLADLGEVLEENSSVQKTEKV